MVAMFLMLLLYVYIVLFLRTCFLKSERLDHIWDMVSTVFINWPFDLIDIDCYSLNVIHGLVVIVL